MAQIEELALNRRATFLSAAVGRDVRVWDGVCRKGWESGKLCPAG